MIGWFARKGVGDSPTERAQGKQELSGSEEIARRDELKSDYVWWHKKKKQRFNHAKRRQKRSWLQDVDLKEKTAPSSWNSTGSSDF